MRTVVHDAIKVRKPVDEFWLLRTKDGDGYLYFAGYVWAQSRMAAARYHTKDVAEDVRRAHTPGSGLPKGANVRVVRVRVYRKEGMS